jgi:hypothetical protein
MPRVSAAPWVLEAVLWLAVLMFPVCMVVLSVTLVRGLRSGQVTLKRVAYLRKVQPISYWFGVAINLFGLLMSLSMTSLFVAALVKTLRQPS